MKVLKNRVVGASGPYTFVWCKPGEVIFLDNPENVSCIAVADGFKFFMNTEDHKIYISPDPSEQILR